MYRKIIKNVSSSLDLRVTNDKGNGVEGLAIQYKIVRAEDNAIILSGNMDDVGQGVYKTNVLLSVIGQYRVLYDLEDYYTDSIETLIVEEDVNAKLNLLIATINELAKKLETKQDQEQELPPIRRELSISRKNEVVFLYFYEKLISEGWTLFKIEGSNYFFYRVEVI